MDLEDAGATDRYLIRDRGSKFPALFGQVLADAGVQVVLTGYPGAAHERSHGALGAETCRHELLAQTLIWNESHLRRALREFEQHHRAHRPPRDEPGSATAPGA